MRAALLKQAIPPALHEMWQALQKYDREQLDTLFADPVNPKEYKDYPDYIKEPMDLKTLGSVPDLGSQHGCDRKQALY